MSGLSRTKTVSFDVDDTLVCHHPGAPTEKRTWLGLIFRWFGEPLRSGARTLMTELRTRGCAIWIYTTSGRSMSGIKLWLWFYGIRVDGVVNDELHHKMITNRGLPRPPSKYPPGFGIDLHVDDSDGVRMEGVRHGFRVIVVRPDDQDWVRRVLDEVNKDEPPTPRVTPRTYPTERSC